MTVNWTLVLQFIFIRWNTTHPFKTRNKTKDVQNVLYIERVDYNTLGKTYTHSLTAIISMWWHFVWF